MRDVEIGILHYLIAIKKDVEIDLTGGVGVGCFAAQFFFDRPKSLLQFPGRETGFNLPDGVQVFSLRRTADRVRLVNTRAPSKAGMGDLGDKPLGLVKVGLPIAQIGTNPKINAHHESLSFVDQLNSSQGLFETLLGDRQGGADVALAIGAKTIPGCHDNLGLFEELHCQFL